MNKENRGSRFIDMTGLRFGRLVAKERKSVRVNNKTRSYWLCRCDCGNEKLILRDNLMKGATKSCGCIVATKKGISSNRIMKILDGMKRRCYNNSDKSYDTYGARGIKICDEWLNNDFAFYNWSLENGYNEGLTIDRIDPNGNYEPENCRWATMKEQNNNRRNNVNITIGKTTRTMTQWSEMTGISIWKIHKRYHDGLKGEDIIAEFYDNES
ncbi:hypothetical protein [Paenibacillus sp. ISL-20]|uniref:hypothetical protein n=1 Tax=Paenibacillus sp. ISL-20 TaxID=2819163 RepID=UPI001BE79468|nr:hypothetical protein [Paenibacillus sp. ISL-20]MBT2759918.1 hypothetical protein [Paenibacillus sp. ISL-20]